MAGELLERVAEAADREPRRVRPVLQVLVGDTPRISPQLRPVAKRLNRARRAMALEEFLAGAVPTDEAIGRLPSIGTRQGIHRLRKAGRLLGRTVGNTTWFPAWQFSDGGLRDDLDEILAHLDELTSDVVAADRVMRLPRPELGGASIADALDQPRRRPRALRLLAAVGGG